jgi:hypothetical protein
MSILQERSRIPGTPCGREGLRMVNDKVEAVENWPTPSCQKDVEEFLGLAGYYRHFIKDFSRIAGPLADLTGTQRKGKGVGAGGGKPTRTPVKKFVWTVDHDQAFAQVKRAIASAPCLANPDPERPFVVHTDASGLATGGY